jgi:hypothetical protein
MSVVSVLLVVEVYGSQVFANVSNGDFFLLAVRVEIDARFPFV